MKAEKTFGFFLLTFVSVLVLAATIVSAAPLTTGDTFSVEVDGLEVTTAGPNPAVVTGDTVSIRVEFDSAVNASDVTVEVELETDKEDVEAQTRVFDVETGNEYVKTLKLEVPFDLQDELSDFVTLNVEISGDGFKTEDNFSLRVQREPFNADIKSVSVPQTINAGDTFPVDLVLKNMGYNDLDDLFVTVGISALDTERTAFFGDLVALECDDDAIGGAVENYGVDIDRKCNEDDEDTLAGRIFLQVPFDAQSGVYTLEVTIENDDTVSSETVQIAIDNAFSAGNFIVSGNTLLIVNPTNEVVVYRIVPESTGAVSVSVSDSLVAVPAGSSATVVTDATSSVSGIQTYSVNIFSADGALVDTISFSKSFEGNDVTSPIVVLTFILAIIFIVLLVVLIVLIGKKPEKSEEFGESYY